MGYADENEVHFRRDIALRDEGLDDPDPNEYGFYPAHSTPAGSVSIAELDGTWRCGDDYIYFYDGSLYTGYYTITYADKTLEEGYVDLEYTINPDDSKEYHYNLYTYDGKFLMGFGVSGELPLNDLYEGQSGEPHYVREKTDGNANDFLGIWACGRMNAVIEEDGGDYLVNIQWSWDAGSGVIYEYRCSYDAADSILRCDGTGTRTEYSYDESGNSTSTVTDEKISASFEIIDGDLYWTDGTDEFSEPQMFAR